MQVADFHFDLPEELIAKAPKKQRSSSKLMALNGQTGDIKHCQFEQIVELVNEGDLLIFNNTRVIPARLFGLKESGGKVEILVERLIFRVLFITDNLYKVEYIYSKYQKMDDVTEYE